MSKIVTLEKFCDDYNKINSKDSFIRQFINEEYVPVSEKLKYFETAVNNSIHNENVEPLVRYFEYIKALVQIYTNINVDGLPSVEVYDSLQRVGALPLIFGIIGEDKLKEMNMFMTYITDKVLGDNNGIC